MTSLLLRPEDKSWRVMNFFSPEMSKDELSGISVLLFIPTKLSHPPPPHTHTHTHTPFYTPKAEGYCFGIVHPTVTLVHPEPSYVTIVWDLMNLKNKCVLSYCAGAHANFVRIDLVTPVIPP